MFKFTSLFFNNLVGPVLAPTTTMIMPSATSVYGTSLAGEQPFDGLTLSYSAISAGTVLCDAYCDTISQLQDTQAYVESLNEEELVELINKLEAKDYLIEETEDEIVVKKKILD